MLGMDLLSVSGVLGEAVEVNGWDDIGVKNRVREIVSFTLAGKAILATLVIQ